MVHGTSWKDIIVSATFIKIIEREEWSVAYSLVALRSDMTSIATCLTCNGGRQSSSHYCSCTTAQVAHKHAHTHAHSHTPLGSCPELAW